MRWATTRVTCPIRRSLRAAASTRQRLTDLLGIRLAIMEETSEQRRLDILKIKKVTGTEEITARRIKQDTITWRPTHTLFITTNYLPQVEETDHGTWRRLKMLRFPHTFRKNAADVTGPNDRLGDPGLKRRLRRNGSKGQQAALAWIVAGAVRYYAAGQVVPEPPDEVVEATKEWRREQDPLIGYADERIIFDPTRAVLATDLLADLNDYLRANGHRPWSDKTLAAKVLVGTVLSR